MTSDVARPRGRPRQHPDLARVPVAFRLDRLLRMAMVDYRDRVGMSLAEQMRRAIGAWIALHSKRPPRHDVEQKITSALRG